MILFIMDMNFTMTILLVFWGEIMFMSICLSIMIKSTIYIYRFI